MHFRVVILCYVLGLVQSDLLAANSIPIAENKEIVTNTRIVGGHDAVIGQFPHLVSLQCVNPQRSYHFCAGNIIHPLWVLTAAHCIFHAAINCRQDDVIVKAGKHNINLVETSEQAIKAQYSFVHELYDAGTNPGPNDVALLKLERPFLLNDLVKMISLPLPYSEPKGKVQLAGWGNINAAQTVMASILQTAEVPIIDIKVCNASISVIDPTLPGLLQESNICTGPLTGGISHCKGDSGGSLSTTIYGVKELIGIVSWGFSPCGMEGGPAMSAKVSHYVYWILDKIAKN